MKQSVLKSHPFTAQYLEKPTATAKYLQMEDEDDGSCVALYRDNADRWYAEEHGIAWAEAFRPGSIELVESLEPCDRQDRRTAQEYDDRDRCLPDGLSYIGRRGPNHILYAWDRERFFLVPDEVYGYITVDTVRGLERAYRPNSVLVPSLLMVREDGCVKMEGV